MAKAKDIQYILQLNGNGRLQRMKNSMNSEMVAVIMSVYDGDNIQYIEQSIDSILSQSYKKLSLFVYLDGVTNDNIRSYVDGVAKVHSNVYPFYSKENNGLAYALNYLINKVKAMGDYTYIARMDADDISDVERISEQVTFFKDNPDISILGTNCIEINESGEDVYRKKMPETHSELERFIFKRSPMIHPSVMFRGKVIDDIVYNVELKNTQDYYLWVDLLSKKYKFHNLQKFLIKFRVADDFYSRRGMGKVLNEMKSRLYAINKLDGKNILNYTYMVFFFILRVSPVFIKKICYRTMR